MGTVANVVVGTATVTIGTANAFPTTTDPGFTVDGVNFIYESETKDIDCNETTVAIDRAIIKEQMRVRLNMMESTLTNFDYAAIGSDNATTRTIKLGGGVENYVSVLVTGTAPGTSASRQILIPRVTATGSVEVPYQKGEANIIPAEFTALKPTAGNPVDIYDYWAATISSGTFAHSDAQSSYLVAGEGDAADALTDITNGSHGDKVVLRIADADNAITVTDNDAALELDGDTNFVMDDRRDWLELEYDTDHWVEADRFDASA